MDQLSPSMRTIVDARVPPVSPESKNERQAVAELLDDLVSHCVHEGWPERLALVPVTGPPTASMSAVAMRESAQRSATRPRVSRHLERQAVRRLDDQRQCAGPEFVREREKCIRHVAHQVDGLLDGIDEDGQRAGFGAPLYLENALDGVKVERISGRGRRKCPWEC